MDPTIVMFVFRTASRKPSICLDFVIKVMGIQRKFCSKNGMYLLCDTKTSY